MELTLSVSVFQSPFWIPLSSTVYSVLFFGGWGISLSRGLCWFIQGVAEGYHMMLGAHLFGLLKVSQAHLELVACGPVDGCGSGLAGRRAAVACLFFQCIVAWRILPWARGAGCQFQLSLVLHLSQACLQNLSQVPDLQSSCYLCLCLSRHFGAPLCWLLIIYLFFFFLIYKNYEGGQLLTFVKWLTDIRIPLYLMISK
jgi:hypothetical protein